MKDGEIIYRYALQYSSMLDIFISGQRLSMKLNGIDPDSNNNIKKYNIIAETIVARLVNIAFSIELYLKAILKYKGNDYRYIHKLDDLYEKLGDSCKKEISDAVIRLYKEQCGEDISNTFIEILKKNANVFVDWRYAYEKHTEANVDFLIILSEVIKLYAINIFEPEYINKMTNNK